MLSCSSSVRLPLPLPLPPSIACHGIAAMVTENEGTPTGYPYPPHSGTNPVISAHCCVNKIPPVIVFAAWTPHKLSKVVMKSGAGDRQINGEGKGREGGREKEKRRGMEEGRKLTSDGSEGG
eukprot:758079-Hanusia_phi.AAC.6